MKISKKQIEHIAELAKLDLGEQEKEIYSEQLSEILDYVDQLKKVEVEEKSNSHITDLENISREDEAEVSRLDKISKDDLLKNVPAKDQIFVKVPKILDFEG